TCRRASRIRPPPAAPSSCATVNSRRPAPAGLASRGTGHTGPPRGLPGHRVEHVGVPARPVAGVACAADLIDLDQYRVAVAVQCHRLDPLLVAGRLALDPVLLAA